jgi:hypothetical protein
VFGAVGATTGTGTLTGVGGAVTGAVGSTSGVGVLTGVGAAIAAAVGSAAGLGTLTGVGFAAGLNIISAIGTLLGTSALVGFSGLAPGSAARDRILILWEDRSNRTYLVQEETRGNQQGVVSTSRTYTPEEQIRLIKVS